MEMVRKTCIDDEHDHVIKFRGRSVSQDIWFEILKQLPVKTLGTCRCVCKTWHSLVASPCFIAAHLRHYTLNPLNSMLFCKNRYCFSIQEEKMKREHCIFFRDSSQLKQGVRLDTSVFPVVVPWYRTQYSSFDLVGSVNGLLCLLDSSCLTPTGRVFIWNPLLKKTIQLPMSSSMCFDPVLGFGYDVRKHDHRVVKINDGASLPLVEVYSLQKRTWRTVVVCGKFLVNKNSTGHVSQRQCFLNGVIHWLIPNRRLLLFDVSDEAFSKMELPQDIDDIYACKTTVGVFEYQGKLSVSQCHDRVGSEIYGKCQIWVKRDYNVGNSWCKILCIGMVHDDLYTVGPVEYLGDNEEIIMSAKGDDDRGELVLCNPETKEFKQVGIRKTQSTSFRTYTPTLALLDLKTDQLDLTTEELERFRKRRRRRLRDWIA